MRYNYAINIYFRNGKKIELLGNQCSTFTDPGGVSMVLALDKEIIVELPEGIGNAIEVGQVTHYNAFPRPALYDLFPSDWDPKKESFLLIDRINIDSRGREADSNAPSATTPPVGIPSVPNGGC